MYPFHNPHRWRLVGLEIVAFKLTAKCIVTRESYFSHVIPLPLCGRCEPGIYPSAEKCRSVRELFIDTLCLNFHAHEHVANLNKIFRNGNFYYSFAFPQHRRGNWISQRVARLKFKFRHVLRKCCAGLLLVKCFSRSAFPRPLLIKKIFRRLIKKSFRFRIIFSGCRSGNDIKGGKMSFLLASICYLICDSQPGV